VRIHRLTVSAFGPFPDAVTIDFDEVCAAGLFLIHGATGSGKTSLLDAICFALFANVPGARSKKSLASHHATEGTKPSVTLEFTAAGRRFQVERSPEYLRPKKRGTGLLRMQATVTLEEQRSGRWEILATRHDDVALILDDVLGMGLEQFAKVVVLPQGDVSAFLRSSPEERRTLLERLFDISTFTDVETWLAEERRRTSAELEEARAAIAHELRRLDDLVETTDECPWHSLPIEDVPAALDAAAGQLSGEVSLLLARADEADVACGAATSALLEARTVAALRSRGMQALAAQEQALSQAPEIEALRVRVRQSLAAEGVSGHLAALDASLTERTDAAKTLRALRSSLAGVLSPESSLHELAAIHERLRAADALLAELTHTGVECARAERDEAARRSALESAERAARLADEEVARVREDHEAASKSVEGLRAAASRHVGVQAEHDRATRMLRLARRVAEETRRRDEAAPALMGARQNLLTAQKVLLHLQERRLEGMAGVLAGGLLDGEACPVCGSPEHPAPAAGRDVVSAEELEAAESEHEGARAAVAELEQAHSAATGRIESLLEQLEDSVAALGSEVDSSHGDIRLVVAQGRPLDLVTLAPALEELVERTSDALAEASQAKAALAVAEAALAKCAVTLRTRDEAEQDARRARAVAASAFRDAEARHREQSQRVAELLARHEDECGCSPISEGSSSPGAPADDDSVWETAASIDADRIIADHRTLTDQVERVLAAERTVTEAEERCADLEAAAVQAAAERGFTSLDEVRLARLGARELSAAQARISEHDQAVAVAEATLADEEVAAALELPEPDVDGAGEQESIARRAVREAQAAHTAAEARLRVLESVRSEVTDRVEQLVSLRQRAAAVKELADAVGGTGGGNELRMRLSSFVLAARLEKVVALANERLHTMDAGRYLLEHSDARVAGGARSGLDLRVLDQWTGRSRETSSLSGGETFMVSLALALGLADAVREEGGGFDLGTLFIDEGFGSLDDESLEQVMGVLDALREGGRAVGVVSHVADLRTRITHQVVVRKSASGSQAEVRICA